MKLPGAETNELHEDILNLIDDIHEDPEKVIRFTLPRSGDEEVTVYAAYAFDSVGTTDEERSIYAVRVPGRHFVRTVYRSRRALHDGMLDGLEAEVVSIQDIDGEDVREWCQRIDETEDPIEHVYVFVKSTDDGRYKDRWKYYKGDSEEEIREREGLPKPSSDEKWVYHCLGNIAELREHAEEYNFDIKKNWSGRFFTELGYMTGEDELKELREKASADSRRRSDRE